MTRDDIVNFARDAGFVGVDARHLAAFSRFAALVAAAEREACAEVCDATSYDVVRDCAEAIRARGEKGQS